MVKFDQIGHSKAMSLSERGKLTSVSRLGQVWDGFLLTEGEEKDSFSCFLLPWWRLEKRTN